MEEEHGGRGRRVVVVGALVWIGRGDGLWWVRLGGAVIFVVSGVVVEKMLGE